MCLKNEPSTWISIGSIIVASLSAVFTGLQYDLAAQLNEQGIKRIQYHAALKRKESDGSARLLIWQVSGEPYIITGVKIKPAIENKHGGSISADPFYLPTIGSLSFHGRLPRYEIGNIGKEICARRPKFGEEACTPNQNFDLSFSYSVFEVEKRFMAVERLGN